MANDKITIKEASIWASEFLSKNVTVSNISYLVQYGKVKKYEENGNVYIQKNDLKKYYDGYHGKRQIDWKNKLGEDLIWELSFDNLREKDTTKHVHRLHPYKGKFIPQLVEYFLDEHKDDHKKEVFFRKGDTVLDPFCGSGTTLVESNELGINAIGVDISVFNALISNIKTKAIDLINLKLTIDSITSKLNIYGYEKGIDEFEKELLEELRIFNEANFPTPEFRYKVSQGEINEKEYGGKKEKEFLNTYNKLVKKYKIELNQHSPDSFLYTWYMQSTLKEIHYVKSLLDKVEDKAIQEILMIILSRTIRSCRATTHSDLATLKEPKITSYYCVKHKKICKPIFSIRKKWKTYSNDTLNRFVEFSKFRTDTKQYCIVGDSREIDLISELQKHDIQFSNKVKEKKIDGIFSSPPYVGMINYHEQHEYSYDLFEFKRRDDQEIGPLFKGKGKQAQASYIEGISAVLINCKKFMKEDFNIFLVANDKYNLYPEIAKNSGLRIVNQFKRPVLNRTERDKGAYAEYIFHLKNS